MSSRETDRRIDERLRAAFEPPAPDELAAMAERVSAPSGVRRPLWPLLWAAAALLVVVLLVIGDRPVVDSDGARLGALWVAAYEDAAARGFTGGCCETGFDLPAACEEMFSSRIDVVGTGDVAILGAYCGLDTGGCMALIARDGETPVCVYVVPRADDPKVELPASSRLHLARRELGSLVLYALSPAPSGAALTDFVEL